MANIQNELNNIKNAVFGKDVRSSIHDAIKTCYDDASVVNDNANMEVKLARGVYKTLNERLNESDKKQEEISSQLEHSVNDLNVKINEVASKGTTVEVLERVTKEEIDRQIEDGTIANLTIESDSITSDKYKNKSITADKTNFIKSYYNMANLEEITEGKYWSSHLETVIESNGQNVATLPVIQLNAGCTYQMNRINSSFCWVIDDITGAKVKLSDHQGFSRFNRGGLNLVELTVTNNSKLYITVATNLHYSDLMVVEGVLPYTYKKFNKPYNYEINGIPVNGIYEEIVRIGTGKDFATLREFVSRLSVDYPLDKLHQLTMVLDDGEHHLDTEFDMPQYVNMVSASNDPNKCKVLYTPTNVTSEQVSALSGLKMSKPNNKLKGIHFIGKNCRYVVHPESNGAFPNSLIEIDNCIFEHLINDLGSWESQFAWGEGTSSGARLIANNCTFISHSDKSLAFSVHNNVNFENPMIYTLNNCHFYSYGYGSCFRCEGMKSGTDDRVYLNNCELNGNIMLTNALSIKLYAMGTTHVCCSSNNYFESNSQAIYPDCTKLILNSSSEMIPKGTIVCYDNDYKKIRKMTSNDSSEILAGFTIGDTNPNELAFVVTNGWYRYTDDFTMWKKFGVIDGKLDASAENKVGMIVGGGFIRIKSNI